VIGVDVRGVVLALFVVHRRNRAGADNRRDNESQFLEWQSRWLSKFKNKGNSQ